MKQISPSVLDVKHEEFLDYINTLVDWGVKRIHYDVMDGCFVPNKGIPENLILETISKAKKHEIEFHLMVKDVFQYYNIYSKHKGLLIFHYEAMNKQTLEELINKAKHDNVKLGLAINPNTNEKEIINYLKDLSLILVMSVNPGLGGQSFIEDSYNKISNLRKYIDKNNLKTIIEVDGGVKQHNIKKCFEAGVDVAVVGSYLVNNFSKKTVEELLD
ncbi:ribulose-phosphate 3-epimerase [Mycoplasma enhydrae]|uniref:ribulose-phosphate 3-epimerase n=1 Tax=Mycoplasma enhydrae TaxID=2499220 RepID=UPI00197CAB72|nr:ribulose-phosphate 3-epimerase [Mycoplasma enhydrae]MBN4089350.1 ribulose-phosphate 3-epimerase [Mycoplasma enhydrae]